MLVNYIIFVDYICSVECRNVLVVLQINCFDTVCCESIELLYVFPSWVVNPYKQKDNHSLFCLLNVGTLKLQPNMATLTSSARAQ